MKRLSTFLLALLLMSIGANAESVTLSNSWLNSSGSTASDYGSYAKENFYDSDGTGLGTGILLHQTVTSLTANTAYVIEFFAAVNNANGASYPYGENYAQVYAGSTTKDITVEQKSAADFPNTAVDAILGWGDAYHHFLVATSDEDGQIDFGVRNVTAAGNWAIAYAVSATPLAEYTGSATAHKCTVDESAWTASSGGTAPALNTWSTETDASGMVTPFMQVWVGDENGTVTLSSGTISHTQLTGLPEGVYTVSIDARIFSEAGNAIASGTLFTANDVSVDLATQGLDETYSTDDHPNMVGKYGTYTVQCEVGNDGKLDISFTIPSGVTYNWLAWKNLDVEYRGATSSYQYGTTATTETYYLVAGNIVIIDIPDCLRSSEASGATLTATATLGSTEITLTSIWGGMGKFYFTVPTELTLNTEYTLTITSLSWVSGSSTLDTTTPSITITLRTPPFGDMDGMFLKNLYNNDLMSRGKDYGTRADVDFIGIPLAFVLNDEGKYIIRYADADPSEATDNYLYGTAWAWADGNTSNATTFTVEEVKDGEELLGYHFISDYGYLYRYDATIISAEDTNDDYALAVNGIQYPTSGYNYTDDTQAIWTFVDIAERDAIKAQWVSDQKVAVAAAAGITVTNGDDFDKYVASLTETAIVTNEISTSSVGSWTGVDSFNSDGYGVASYQAATRLYRSFTSLESGLYKITLNGFDRNSDNAYSWQMYHDGYTDLSESYIYANGYEINLQAWGSEATYTSGYVPNNMTEASNMFDAGSYLNTLYTYVSDGKLDIQIALLVTEYFGWAQVKNFSLYRLDQTETTIEWTMTDAGYGTLILPFEADLSSDEAYSGLTAYTIESVTTDNDDDDIAATLSLSDAGSTIAANTPYIMAGTAGTYTFTGTPETAANGLTSGKLTGTYELMDCDALLAAAGANTVYLLQNHDNVVAFYPVVEELSSEATLTPYHCYLTLTEDDLKTTSGAPAKLSFSFGGETTAIEAVEGAEAEGNGAIYDLSGRKVSKAVKGVYIQNGKKVLVK